MTFKGDLRYYAAFPIFTAGAVTAMIGSLDFLDARTDYYDAHKYEYALKFGRVEDSSDVWITDKAELNRKHKEERDFYLDRASYNWRTGAKITGIGVGFAVLGLGMLAYKSKEEK